MSSSNSKDILSSCSLTFLQDLSAKVQKKKKGVEKKSLLETVVIEDSMVLCGARFKFRIAKVQQEALNSASGHLPQPSRQLELVSQKRQKKTRGRGHPACTPFLILECNLVLCSH